MPSSDIIIKGAREHNLRDIDLVLPRNQLICLTGVSGSGKSSLAFDTLFAEGQRRYVESLSTFARQFLGQMPKPDVDHISGLSPSISIAQKSAGSNPRSTVGTITEIYDFLRVLYARVGRGHCWKCQRPITAQSREQIIARILMQPAKARFAVLAPVVRRQKGEFCDLADDLRKRGFIRARVDGQIVQLTDNWSLDRQMRHDIEVVVDRLTNGPSVRSRLAEAVENALEVGEGSLIIAPEKGDAELKGAAASGSRSARAKNSSDIFFSADYACNHCGVSFQPPSPQLFSFNSPQGMCFECDGLGQMFSFDPAKLVNQPNRSIAQGCIGLVGEWKSLGRWKRHIYKGVANTIERIEDLPTGTLLETPWEDLAPEHQYLWLWGAGEQHITFTWRGGKNSQMHGGVFDGLIPELLEKYRSARSKNLIAKLEKSMNVIGCPDCLGQRLNPQARTVTLTTTHPDFAAQPAQTLPQVSALSIEEAEKFFSDLELDDTGHKVAVEVLKEVRGRLGFLTDVGLDYLSLERTAPTLSGGETQRIRLAGQIGCGLVGVLYILDEPSIGLHPRDNDRLLATLKRLRDQGNTVVVVEHDEDTMRAADQIIDFGPGPGVRGGEVVAEGSVEAVCREKRSVTGAYLAGRRKIDVPAQRRIEDLSSSAPTLRVAGARHNNLKNVDIEIPLGAFVCLTGASGSGKSSIFSDILVESLRRDLNGGKGAPGEHDAIEGLEHLDKMIAIDQSPIGRTPRSNPATYIKVFDEIRRLYALLPESKRRGYKPGRFSFNVVGGRCEACSGNGSNKLEMDFLADVWITCNVCQGHRFNHEALQIEYKGKSISDVLEMDVQQALEHFENIPKIRDKLATLHAVGLDYLKLGQPSPTLSGGEAQRIKLARELVKKSTGKTLYMLDEPTTGLHFADIELLLKVLHDFVDAGNTVLVVEHNLDVIKTADWVIDLGPDGGKFGGEVVAVGTPEQVVEYALRQCKTPGGNAKSDAGGLALPSHTGMALAGHLGHPGAHVQEQLPPGKGRKTSQATHIVVRGAEQHNLRNVDVKIPRDQFTVFCGPSGSGKSSLAMDTIYAEGQRRYVESLSSYARQFIGQLQKPRVESIEGLSPAIAIEQRTTGHSPRSTVGTVTEIYDYFRILFSRLGQMYCPDCDLAVGTQSADEVIDGVLAESAGTKLYLMAPVELPTGKTYEEFWDALRAAGYARVRVDEQTHSLDSIPAVDRRRKHKLEVIVDRVTIRRAQRGRLAESVENALAMGNGVLHTAVVEEGVPEPRWRTKVHSQHLACGSCGRSFEPLSPHHFSFNNALGWCGACEGLGTEVGANPAALLRSTQFTLAEGAVLVWPNITQPLFAAMLDALSCHTGLPTDIPFDQLTPRHRRIVLHGTGEEWIDVVSSHDNRAVSKKKKNRSPKLQNRFSFRFQYKGLYPALEEASRLSPRLRAKLEHLVDEIECSECDGSRLRDDATAMRFAGRTIAEYGRLPLGQLLAVVEKWKLPGEEKKVAGELVREITNRLTFLVDVGLEYLTIGRHAPTLSGGESQRIRLASQVGSGLCGVLYVLDEPTIGLHPRDNDRLISALHKLRDLGNSLLVVEHDRDVVASADGLLDFGPAAGRLGGEIVARGTPGEVAKKRKSVTGPYLSGKKAIPVPKKRRIENQAAKAKKGRSEAILRVVGARHQNLKSVDVDIPLSTLTAVTGVSGSGKSSLVEEVLYNQLARMLHRAGTNPGAHDRIVGVEQIDKVIRVDQRPLGNTPTSNPATYTGLFELVRQLFAQLPEAKLRGYSARRFSFNVNGGRCDACDGAGEICIEMHFLPDVWVDCDTCQGRRYNPETLEVRYCGRSIADVLEMSCGDALQLFENIPKIRRILQTLCDVGLDYVALGQSAATLSGGEAQRVKLAAELARPDTGKTLYVLDEPTTGLHFDDIVKLLDVLHRLVDLGNTVVVIEHNLDVIKQADWIIDLGPEAGADGGQVVVQGTPEQIVDEIRSAKPGTRKKKKATKKKSATSHPKPKMVSLTAAALAPVLAAGPRKDRKLFDFAAAEACRKGDLEINQLGENVKMPWETDGRRWHTRDRVSRAGETCHWDGKLLDAIERRVQELGEFSPTNWNSRTIVEVAASKKSDGWFFHAITGEPWLLKLKFRTAKKTFQRDQLMVDLDLKSLNDMPEVESYGHGPRIKCKNLRGPWQEVQIAAYSRAELDTPAFWSFVEKAVAGFQKFTDRVEQNCEDVMPWKVLGRRWHLARKGFPPGKRPKWPAEVLEDLLENLGEVAGVEADGSQFLWNNQQVVHLRVAGQREPWATVYTKRLAGVDLVLSGPCGAFASGRIASLAAERAIRGGENLDQVKLRFIKPEDLSPAALAEFLGEHLEAVRGVASEATTN
ncbi:MAG: excinuclease ABC subunit UvrA [Pirellulales bacterium]|nr:excinuclease ABC subunit UvrA [Pirellulales bacterium]